MYMRKEEQITPGENNAVRNRVYTLGRKTSSRGNPALAQVR